MSTDTPTAEPWEAVKKLDHNWRVMAGDKTVCDCGPGPAAEQDAKAIARLPDFLRTLKAIKRDCPVTWRDKIETVLG